MALKNEANRTGEVEAETEWTMKAALSNTCSGGGKAGKGAEKQNIFLDDQSPDLEQRRGAAHPGVP